MAQQRDYLFEERAAIMEFDGEMPRAEAEKKAAEDMKEVRAELRRQRGR